MLILPLSRPSFEGIVRLINNSFVFQEIVSPSLSLSLWLFLNWIWWIALEKKRENLLNAILTMQFYFAFVLEKFSADHLRWFFVSHQQLFVWVKNVYHLHFQLHLSFFFEMKSSEKENCKTHVLVLPSRAFFFFFYSSIFKITMLVLFVLLFALLFIILVWETVKILFATDEEQQKKNVATPWMSSARFVLFFSSNIPRFHLILNSNVRFVSLICIHITVTDLH